MLFVLSIAAHCNHTECKAQLCIRTHLVEHVGVAGLNLGLQNSKPQLLGAHNTLGAALLLIALVQPVKLLSPAVCQARGLIGAEQGPVLIVLNTPAGQEIVRADQGKCNSHCQVIIL